jgi:cytochrome b561
MMSAPKGYSATQIGLHWLIAVLIIFQLIFGEDMTRVWRAIKNGTPATLDLWAWAHILVGIAVLVFAGWRLLLRATRGVPEAPHGGSAMATKAAEAGHWLLYALMIAAPVTGLLAWYGGVSSAAELHELLKPLFIILVAVHVVAALWHHFGLKDGLLDRMRRPQD